MESYILIAEKSLSFRNLKEILLKKFICYEVSESRLTVENGKDHIFIDYDDNMKEDYENENIRNSDSHFFAISYTSKEFAKLIILELKEFSIQIDNDCGTILPIKLFLEI